jgi:predicted kinase/GNAT superfamily N-acetyltransferase
VAERWCPSRAFEACRPVPGFGNVPGEDDPIPTHGRTQVTSRRHAVWVAAGGELRIWDRQVGAGETCRRILKALPTWFGIPASVDDYVAAADRYPTVIASLGDEDVGLLTVVRHSEYAAEVYVMAVVPQLHRQGIGRALLEQAERVLAADGVGFLQVKTLAASKPDDGYDKTRAFYLAYGFRPLEEFRHLWDAENPALQMIKVVPMAKSLTRLVLICGLPASGKSTLARQLARTIPAVRLDKDGWATQLGADLWDEEFRARLEHQLWVLSQDLLTRGQSVILEWGHWARVERDEKRLGARALGVGVELHYLDAPLEELIERAERRNTSGEWTASPMTRAHFETWATMFQPPDEEEIQLFDKPVAEG